jgi:fibrillarin-like rRNA methylase
LNINNSGLLWKNFNGNKQLFTENNSASNTSERHLSRWNPYTSKLAAALFSGMEIFPINPTSKVFYLDDYSTTTLEHLTNIISSDGLVDFSKDTENLDTTNFVKLKEKTDVVYFDSSEDKKLDLIIKNCKIILKKNGFLILILNNKEPIDDESQGKTQKIINNLKESLELIQEINLSYFFKNSFMIIMRNSK